MAYESNIGRALTIFCLICIRFYFLIPAAAWCPRHVPKSSAGATRIFASNGANEDSNAVDVAEKVKNTVVQEYKNVPTKVLSNFMGMSKSEKTSTAVGSKLDEIDFDSPTKIAPGTDLETLAAALDYDLIQREWFVTGNVNPIYFSDEFVFDDPDVKVDGIEDYAKGVRKLFDQSTSRAEIARTVVTGENEITCTWRLSGKVDIGFGLPIKPYMIDTIFAVDPETSLIISQEDKFALPSWDILLSSLFPFLIGKVTAPPAPPLEKRDVAMVKLKTTDDVSPFSSQKSPFDVLANLFQSQR